MQTPANSKRSYRFGLFEADAANGELLRQGIRVRLQDQPFRLLTILLERAGEVVSREELRQKLWPADTYVEFDGSLNAALKRLRAALGDPADNPIFIETLPKRGYRFIAPVSVEVEKIELEAEEKVSDKEPLVQAPAAPAGRQSVSHPTRPSRFQSRGILVYFGIPAAIILAGLG